MRYKRSGRSEREPARIEKDMAGSFEKAGDS